MPGPTPGVWPRKADGWWCTTIKGRQVRLLKMTEGGKTAAETELRKRLAKPEAKAQDKVAVAVVLEQYLDHCCAAASGITPKRAKLVGHALRSFCGSRSPATRMQYGELAIDELRPDHAQEWLDQQSWKRGTKSQYLQVIRTALRWARRKRIIDRKPLDGIQAPGYDAREVMPSPRDIKRLLAAKDRRLRDLLFVLVHTGCRPSEAARVTAADVDLRRKCWILKTHKTSKKSPRPRVIWLSLKMLALTKRRMKERPAGVLFQNAWGRPFTSQSLAAQLMRLRQAVKFDQPVTAYSIRHWYITKSLLAGNSAETVAELCGTSPQMIWRNYAHLLIDSKHMLRAVERVGR